VSIASVRLLVCYLKWGFNFISLNEDLVLDLVTQLLSEEVFHKGVRGVHIHVVVTLDLAFLIVVLMHDTTQLLSGAKLYLFEGVLRLEARGISCT
jgi:hypothetical protein